MNGVRECVCNCVKNKCLYCLCVCMCLVNVKKSRFVCPYKRVYIYVCGSQELCLLTLLWKWDIPLGRPPPLSSFLGPKGGEKREQKWWQTIEARQINAPRQYWCLSCQTREREKERERRRRERERERERERIETKKAKRYEDWYTRLLSIFSSIKLNLQAKNGPQINL